MKKFVICFLLIMAFVFAGCTANAQTEIFNVSEVKLDKETVYIKVGEKAELNAQVFPFNAHNQVVYWNTSNANVASVDSKGKVTAKKAGEAEITATSADGGYSSKCKVEVMENVMKSYMGDVNAQKTNLIKNNSNNNFVNSNEPSSTILNESKSYVENFFQNINNLFLKQQEYFDNLFNKINNFENVEIIEQKEEERTIEDGTIVKIKQTKYKAK